MRRGDARVELFLRDASLHLPRRDLLFDVRSEPLHGAVRRVRHELEVHPGQERHLRGQHPRRVLFHPASELLRGDVVLLHLTRDVHGGAARSSAPSSGVNTRRRRFGSSPRSTCGGASPRRRSAGTTRRTSSARPR
eukprot:31532-Pelagococcus_subviridis.AAC.29